MSNPIAEGNRVRVKDREQLPADIKSQMFFDHYRNMVGTVAKTYADGTVAVHVEPDALTKEMAQRHTDTSEKNRQKWLGDLSEEARNRLTAAEKATPMRYTILVAATDVDLYDGPSKLPQAKAIAQSSAPKPPAALEEPAPARKTLAELEEEEARHLEEIRRQNQG